MSEPPILRPGHNCMAVARATRAAVLIDGENYFRALARALAQARRSVFIVGWDIRADLVLEQDEPQCGTLGEILLRQVERAPDLEIHVLIWDWLITYSIERQPLPGWRFSVDHPRLRLELDDHHPLGGSHHEKMVVIDGSLAFVGGLDLATGRYDTRLHRPGDDLRSVQDEEPPKPFHDMMMMVEGPIAAEVQTIAMQRWKNVTERDPVSCKEHRPLWVDVVEPQWRDVPFAVARTRAPYGQTAKTDEISALWLDAVTSARHHIYLENQYLTYPQVREALRKRLEEVPGLVVLIVTGEVCQGFLETAVMDLGRQRFAQALAPFADRCRLVYPEVDGLGITVHSKMLIVDDRFLMVGSANLARRSMGLDSETNLAYESIEADENIRRLRLDLMAEHLDCSIEELDAEEKAGASLIQMVDAHDNEPRRLLGLGIDLPDLIEGLELPADLADPPEPLISGEVLKVIGTPRARRQMRVVMARLAGLLGIAGAIVSLTHSHLMTPWILLPLSAMLFMAWVAIEPFLRKKPMIAN
ncbi:MAG: phospholipase D-like domain-containing protein [Geminicoccaceae bacterium]|nr:hypothetical protein [Geminicoccaceae bacterium]